MAELASARVKEAVDSMVEEVDRTCIRKMMGNMHKCSVICCDNSTSSMEDVYRCIDSCSSSVNGAQTFLRNELTNYQARLQRCVMQCQDSTADKILPTTTEAEIGVFKKDFEQCVVKCADAHIALIPSMLKRMKEVLNRNYAKKDII